MEAKKIFDETLKQDGYVSQESVMPQYNSCLKAVKKALTISLTDTEEKMYSREEMVENLKILYYDGLVEIDNGKSLDKWIEETL